MTRQGASPKPTSVGDKKPKLLTFVYFMTEAATINGGHVFSAPDQDGIWQALGIPNPFGNSGNGTSPTADIFISANPSGVQQTVRPLGAQWATRLHSDRAALPREVLSFYDHVAVLFPQRLHAGDVHWIAKEYAVNPSLLPAVLTLFEKILLANPALIPQKIFSELVLRAIESRDRDTVCMGYGLVLAAAYHHPGIISADLVTRAMDALSNQKDDGIKETGRNCLGITLHRMASQVTTGLEAKLKQDFIRARGDEWKNLCFWLKFLAPFLSHPDKWVRLTLEKMDSMKNEKRGYAYGFLQSLANAHPEAFRGQSLQWLDDEVKMLLGFKDTTERAENLVYLVWMMGFLWPLGRKDDSTAGRWTEFLSDSRMGLAPRFSPRVFFWAKARISDSPHGFDEEGFPILAAENRSPNVSNERVQFLNQLVMQARQAPLSLPLKLMLVSYADCVFRDTMKMETLADFWMWCQGNMVAQFNARASYAAVSMDEMDFPHGSDKYRDFVQRVIDHLKNRGALSLSWLATCFEIGQGPEAADVFGFNHQNLPLMAKRASDVFRGRLSLYSVNYSGQKLVFPPFGFMEEALRQLFGEAFQGFEYRLDPVSPEERLAMRAQGKYVVRLGFEPSHLDDDPRKPRVDAFFRAMADVYRAVHQLSMPQSYHLAAQQLYQIAVALEPSDGECFAWGLAKKTLVDLENGGKTGHPTAQDFFNRLWSPFHFYFAQNWNEALSLDEKTRMLDYLCSHVYGEKYLGSKNGDIKAGDFMPGYALDGWPTEKLEAYQKFIANYLAALKGLPDNAIVNQCRQYLRQLNADIDGVLQQRPEAARPWNTNDLGDNQIAQCLSPEEAGCLIRVYHRAYQLGLSLDRARALQDLVRRAWQGLAKFEDVSCLLKEFGFETWQNQQVDETRIPANDTNGNIGYLGDPLETIQRLKNLCLLPEEVVQLEELILTARWRLSQSHYRREVVILLNKMIPGMPEEDRAYWAEVRWNILTTMDDVIDLLLNGFDMAFVRGGRRIERVYRDNFTSVYALTLTDNICGREVHGEIKVIRIPYTNVVKGIRFWFDLRGFVNSDQVIQSIICALAVDYPFAYSISFLVDDAENGVVRQEWTNSGQGGFVLDFETLPFGDRQNNRQHLSRLGLVPTSDVQSASRGILHKLKYQLGQCLGRAEEFLPNAEEQGRWFEWFDQIIKDMDPDSHGYQLVAAARHVLLLRAPNFFERVQNIVQQILGPLWELNSGSPIDSDKPFVREYRFTVDNGRFRRTFTLALEENHGDEFLEIYITYHHESEALDACVLVKGLMAAFPQLRKVITRSFLDERRSVKTQWKRHGIRDFRLESDELLEKVPTPGRSSDFFTRRTRRPSSEPPMPDFVEPFSGVESVLHNRNGPESVSEEIEGALPVQSPRPLHVTGHRARTFIPTVFLPFIPRHHLISPFGRAVFRGGMR